MPASALRSAIESLAPKLVALSLTVPPPRARAREYGAVCGSTPWLVGGAGAASVADLIEKFGGTVAPQDVEDLRVCVRALVSAARRGKRAR